MLLSLRDNKLTNLSCNDVCKDVPTTVRNPQANAVCERLHKPIANMLCILLRQSQPVNVANVGKLVDLAIATSLHAACSAIQFIILLKFHQEVWLSIKMCFLIFLN
jgi:chromosome condensin MukBEF complex kleisin-like MukF subunit